jgi:hypothetical protein
MEREEKNWIFLGGTGQEMPGPPGPNLFFFRADLSNERRITTEEGQQCAERLGMEFLEISCKSGINTETPFLMLLEKLIEEAGRN